MTTEVDNATVQTTYSGNTVTVRDQAGVKRRSVSDALGRLTQVVEDPDGQALATDYSYDARDDLTGVSQGVQTRAFSYDSLKRLVSATNPENGALSYQYDANGNVTQKADSRVTKTYTPYDGLNRVTGFSFSDGTTPVVTYSYDAPCGKAYLASVSSDASTTSYEYQTATCGDTPAGKVAKSTQTTPTTNGQDYAFAYSYNRAEQVLKGGQMRVSKGGQIRLSNALARRWGRSGPLENSGDLFALFARQGGIEHESNVATVNAPRQFRRAILKQIAPLAVV